MNKKFHVILYIIILIVVLAMFSGTAYAYYKKVIVYMINITLNNANV